MSDYVFKLWLTLHMISLTFGALLFYPTREAMLTALPTRWCLLAAELIAVFIWSATVAMIMYGAIDVTGENDDGEGVL